MATFTISRNQIRQATLLGSMVFLSIISSSQSSIDSILTKLDPQKWAALIGKRADKLEDKIVAKSEKTLNRLQRQEEKIYRRMLHTKDSLQAKAALAGIQEKYQSFRNKLKTPLLSGKTGQYIAKLDTLKTALKFLDKNGVTGKVQDALTKSSSLQDKFAQTEAIKQFIKERRQQLKEQLERLGLVKELKKFNKEVYYYSAQISEYKEILKDSKKTERKALELLSKTKLFKDFMRKNSQLASMFRMPGDPNDPSSQAGLAGLQTRAQVNSIIQQQIATGGPGAQQQFSQNLQEAQSKLQDLKNKIGKAGGNSSDDIMPEGFKPNDQKTKSFLKRLEYGLNIQTQKATNFFPITSDIGLSLGYKPNNKSVIGIGASYKMGWGRGWNNFRISHQGLGLRSYAEVKLKGSFWISAGYEQNYKTAFSEFSQLQSYSAWQKSGLVGLSKMMSVKTKFFKKTKLQILWDFLSNEQRPQTNPFIIRVGYNF